MVSNIGSNFRACIFRCFWRTTCHKCVCALLYTCFSRTWTRARIACAIMFPCLFCIFVPQFFAHTHTCLANSRDRLRPVGRSPAACCCYSRRSFLTAKRPMKLWNSSAQNNSIKAAAATSEAATTVLRHRMSSNGAGRHNNTFISRPCPHHQHAAKNAGS